MNVDTGEFRAIVDELAACRVLPDAPVLELVPAGGAPPRRRRQRRPPAATVNTVFRLGWELGERHALRQDEASQQQTSPRHARPRHLRLVEPGR